MEEHRAHYLKRLAYGLMCRCSAAEVSMWSHIRPHGAVQLVGTGVATGCTLSQFSSSEENTTVRGAAERMRRAPSSKLHEVGIVGVWRPIRKRMFIRSKAG